MNSSSRRSKSKNVKTNLRMKMALNKILRMKSKSQVVKLAKIRSLHIQLVKRIIKSKSKRP